MPPITALFSKANALPVCLNTINIPQAIQASIIKEPKIEELDQCNILSVLFCSCREKIHYIRTEGPQGVEKMSCDADLVMLLRCVSFDKAS